MSTIYGQDATKFQLSLDIVMMPALCFFSVITVV